MTASRRLSVTLPAADHLVHLPGAFRFDAAPDEATTAHVAVTSLGPVHPAATYVVLGGISAGRDVGGPAGWWRDVVGPGRAIDTDVVRVLGIDFLGGPGASSNVANGSLRPGLAVSTHDQARALAAVCDAFGVGRLDAVVGCSYGGQVALAFAEQSAPRVAQIVVLCAAHRSHPMATAWRAIQRRIAVLGAEAGRSHEGLALARALAMTTYRSAVEFEARFDAQPTQRESGSAGPARFAVEDYLDARGEAFGRQFETEEFLALSASLDRHAVTPERVRVPTTLIGFDTDVLVPTWLVADLAVRLAGPCRHVELATVFGHDGFLKESAALAPVLRHALDSAPLDSVPPDSVAPAHSRAPSRPRAVEVSA